MSVQDGMFPDTLGPVYPSCQPQGRKLRAVPKPLDLRDSGASSLVGTHTAAGGPLAASAAKLLSGLTGHAV